MKKLLSLILCSLFFTGVFFLNVQAVLYNPEDIDAGAYYLFSADDGTVICEKNADEKIAPASITKIVTAILTIENCDDLEQIITVPSYTIRLLDGTNSSTAGILVGEEISVRELLYCLLVYSANDAANVLADFIGGGSIDTFVEMMNAFALAQGCGSTHFVNAHGLDDVGHYTTARDIGILYKYCISNSVFSEISGTNRYEMPATNKYTETRYLTNTNKMLNSGIPDYYLEYVKNGKTGTTDSAGHCVVTSASKDGYNYICVMMNAPFYDYDSDGVDENMAFIYSKQLYTWVFDNIRLREVASVSTYVTEVKVGVSKEYDYVSLVPSKSIKALVPSGVDAESVLIEPYAELTASEVNAPIKKGEVLGKAAIKYADSVIAEVDLVAAFDVKRSTVKYAAYLLKRTVQSTVFKVLSVIVAVAVIPLCVYVFAVLPSKRREKKNRIHIVKMNEDSQKRK